MRFSRILSRILIFSRCLLSFICWSGRHEHEGTPKSERKAVIFTKMGGKVLECSIASPLELVSTLFPLPHVEGEMGYDHEYLMSIYASI